MVAYSCIDAVVTSKPRPVSLKSVRGEISLAADNDLGETRFRDRTLEFRTSMSWACRLLAESETLNIDTSVLLVSVIMRRFQPGSPPGFFLTSGSSARIDAGKTSAESATLSMWA
jgi:hypothetical protein